MRLRRADWRPWAFGLLVVAATAQAGDEIVEQDVLQGKGKINWTDKTITARGSGAPNKKAASPAAARLGAERAAKLDAYRNILETLKGVQVSSKKAGKDVLAPAEISTQVEGILRGAQVVDTVYYSDLSVDVVLRMPLDGALTDALVPKPAKRTQVPAQGALKNTGLVINAKGLHVVPAIAPRVIDEKKNEVYGVEFVSEKSMSETGIAGYVKDLDAARKHDRVKDNPLVIKAIETDKGTKTDIVISNADADKLRDPASNQQYLADGKVLIVVD